MIQYQYMAPHFSASRWTPQNHAGHFVFVQHFAQHSVLAENVRLTKVLFDGFRSHFLRQWNGFFDGLVFGGFLGVFVGRFRWRVGWLTVQKCLRYILQRINLTNKVGIYCALKNRHHN